MKNNYKLRGKIMTTFGGMISRGGEKIEKEEEIAKREQEQGGKARI